MAIDIIGRARIVISPDMSVFARSKALFATAGVAAGAAIVAGIGEAMGQANVTSTLQAQLGTTNEVAAKQGKIAGKLYSSGVSGSFQEAADAIKAVVQGGLAPPGATNAQLQSIATKATDVSKVFGQDLGGVTNAVSQMMKTGMAKNSTEAFDIITKGFQSGADKGGDLLDTVNEYGTQFRKVGIDGKQAMGLISQGLQAGARDADIVADAVKEFSIRAVDGSKLTSEGFKGLGLDAGAMGAAIAKGGKSANEALDVTLDRLRGIKDPAERARLATALFGTQAEDLGDALFALDPSAATKKMGDFAGSTEKMGNTLRSGPTFEIQKFMKSIKQAFIEVLGGQVLPILATFGEWLNTYVLPPVTIIATTFAGILVPTLKAVGTAISGVVRWFREMGEWMIPITIAVVGFTVAVSANAIAIGLTTLAMRAAGVAARAWTAIVRIATGVQIAFNLVMNANPIILVITAIIALGAALVVAYRKSETFRNIVNGAFQGVLDVGRAVGAWFSGPFVRFFTETIPGAFRTVLNWVKSNWPWILGALTGPIGLAVGLIIKNWAEVRDFFGRAWGSIKRNALDPMSNFFTRTLPGAARSARDAVVGAFRYLVDKLLGFFGNIISGAAKIFGWVPGVGGKLRSAEREFRKFRDNVNAALGGIKDRNQNTFVTFKGKTIAAVSAGRLASGGPVKGPGTNTSDDVPIMASNDEHMWTAYEVSAVGGHRAMYRMREMARRGELRGYATGGAVSARGRFPSQKTVNSTLNASYRNLVTSSSSALYAMQQQIIDSLTPTVPPGGSGGSGVQRWRGVVQTLLRMLGQPLSYTDLTLRRMNQESGGNPNIVNKWDSNWRAGYPSVGLMQVIRGTFQAYAGKYRNTGPFSYGVSTNPYANVYASMRYALSRYGSLPRAYNRAGGYDQGGWLMPGTTLAFNGTGRPERVVPPGGSGQTIVINVTLENHGAIGSRQEMSNWLAESLDQLRRTGRLSRALGGTA